MFVVAGKNLYNLSVTLYTISNPGFLSLKNCRLTKGSFSLRHTLFELPRPYN